MANYDRYGMFRNNGVVKMVPSVEIYPLDTDHYEQYKVNVTRLDNLSYRYYNDPNYDWLILMANPQYGALEYNIPDGALLRIPYPLNIVLENYKKAIKNYNLLNK